jgi:Flp pilus assembly secretin CpaC
MPRPLAPIAALAALALAAAPAAAEVFRVSVDQTVVVKVPATIDGVVVGNAAVADVAVYDAHTLLITGKSFGATNVLVLDRLGQTAWSRQVAVADDVADGLTIVSAAGIASYSCVEKCRPSPQAGDAQGFFSSANATVQGKAASAEGG